MNLCQKIMQEVDADNMMLLQNLVDSEDRVTASLDKLSKFKEAVRNYKKTGDISYLEGMLPDDDSDDDDDDDTDENENLPEPPPPSTSKGKQVGRPKRNALKDSTNSNGDLSAKGRQPTVKMERISEDFVDSFGSTACAVLGESSVKTEPLVDVKSEGLMLPPSKVPSKRGKNGGKSGSSRGRTTRSKRQLSSRKDSDVIFNKPLIEEIVISDDDQSAKSDTESIVEEVTVKLEEVVIEPKRGRGRPRTTKLIVKVEKSPIIEEIDETDEEAAPVKTTRTKQKKKAAPKESQSDKDSDTESTRVTRTKQRNKTLKSVDSEGTDTEIVSTHSSKTINVQSSSQSNAEEDDGKQNKTDDRSKRLRSPSIEDKKKASLKRKKSGLEEDVVDESLYEDADDKQRPDNATFAVESTKPQDKKLQMSTRVIITESLPEIGPTTTIMNETVIISKPHVIMNETVVISKPIMNETVVISKPIMNETVVISKPIMNETVMITKAPLAQDLEDLMTDDESPSSSPNDPKTPIKTNRKGAAAMFPFENSPVKKRVEAFEKLGQSAENTERTTRTKTRNKEKKDESTPVNQKVYPSASSTQINHTKTLKKPTVMVTPQSQTNRIYKSSNSTTKIHRFLGEAIPAKPASAMKASKEWRELELKRREKEVEVAKKRDALLAAKAEDKRKKREEKEMKVHQQKEALERERERQRDERQRLREEAERKRLGKKKVMAAGELGKVVEGQAMVTVEKVKPIYMTQKMPLLPTEDCYDSDDEASNVKTVRSELEWLSRSAMRKSNLMLSYVDNKLHNTFFCCAPQSPNLQDIFQDIDPRKLTRTSSAVWRKPPRYTLMPGVIVRQED